MTLEEGSSTSPISAKEQEAIGLFEAYHNSFDKNKSVRFLNNAFAVCSSLIKENSIVGYTLKMEILASLAKESNLPSQRHELRNMSMTLRHSLPSFSVYSPRSLV